MLFKVTHRTEQIWPIPASSAKRGALSYVVQKRSHILKLFQRNAYTLPSFSHFLHLVARA